MSITSKVNICNLALQHLKEKFITNIDSPTTDVEIKCSLYYDQVRQSLLRAYNWAFAITRTSIAADTETPAFGWNYQSNSMPSNFLKLLSLHNSSGTIYINNNNQYYEFESNRILTNLSAPYYIKYVRDETEVSKMDKLFIMSFSYLLALAMGKSVGASDSTLEKVEREYDKRWKPTALSASGTENSPVTLIKSPYVDVRRQYTGLNFNESLINLDEEAI